MPLGAFYEINEGAHLFPQQSQKTGDQKQPEEAVRQWCAYELIHAYGTLKHTRQLWLLGPDKHDVQQAAEFAALKGLQLKVGRAWAIKETFSRFWHYKSEAWARRFFADWKRWVDGSGLTPLKKVAKMLEKRLDNIVSYLRHPITNAVTEGLNSKIQAIKASPRGFRSSINYRISILFFCGNLDFYPLYTVKSQFEGIERNEREIDAALAKSAALRQSILHRALTDRLVPQAPADEPATQLLARLRDERVSRVQTTDRKISLSHA